MSNELEKLFTGKNFPKAISDKMIEKGMKPIAFFYRSMVDQLFLKPKYGNMVMSTKNGFTLLESRFNEQKKYILAWNCDQLYRHLSQYHVIAIKPGLFWTVDIESYFSIEPKECMVNLTLIKHDGDVKTIECELNGKLNDPQVPAKMLILLQERGLT